MPIKNGTSAAVAGGGEPPYDGGMERRMTALETRRDMILPTLATRADVEAVRADVEKLAMSTNAQFGEFRAELPAELAKATSSTDTKLGELRAWTLATMITIVGTMLAAIFGISQIYKGSAPASPAATQPAPIIITIPVPFVPTAPAGTK